MLKVISILLFHAAAEVQSFISVIVVSRSVNTQLRYGRICTVGEDILRRKLTKNRSAAAKAAARMTRRTMILFPPGSTADFSGRARMSAGTKKIWLTVR